VIENKNVHYDTEQIGRLYRVAKYVKQVSHPLVIKEFIWTFGDQYLWTRYMLNTSTIVNIGANVMSSSLVTTLSGREPIDADIVTSIPSESAVSFAVIEPEVEKVRVA
jgi:hypothetical protein